MLSRYHIYFSSPENENETQILNFLRKKYFECKNNKSEKRRFHGRTPCQCNLSVQDVENVLKIKIIRRSTGDALEIKR